MKLSIICNTFNNLDITQKCLPDTILRSGVKNKEVIVNDNMSIDGTRQWLRQERIADKLILQDYNIGNPQGVNQCLYLSRGEFIAKIDPDFKMPSNWAAEAIDILVRHSDVGMVGFHWAHGWCERQTDKTSVTYSHLAQGEDMGDYYLPIKVFGVWVFRRSLINTVGCFRDDLSMYGIWDSEFQQRIKNNGLKCVYAKTKEKCYHLGADDLGHRRFKDSELTKAHEKNVDMTLKYWNNSVNFAPNPQL